MRFYNHCIWSLVVDCQCEWSLQHSVNLLSIKIVFVNELNTLYGAEITRYEIWCMLGHPERASTFICMRFTGKMKGPAHSGWFHYAQFLMCWWLQRYLWRDSHFKWHMLYYITWGQHNHVGIIHNNTESLGDHMQCLQIPLRTNVGRASSLTMSI
jgi:hypothetical protein